MDLAIYGMMRSGTTLVADLLTVPGETLVIAEPDFHVQWHARTMDRVDQLLKQVGIQAPTPPLEAGDYESYRDFFEQEIIPCMSGLRYWSIKQVDFRSWQPVLEHFKPKTLILCVRDLRDLALSALDLVNSQLIAFPGGRYLRDEAWVLTKSCHDVVAALAIAERADLVLRYEAFTTDKELQTALAARFGLDEFSRERPNLALEEGRAARETSKHGREISSASVDRFAREPDGPAKALAARVWQLLPEYSSAFDYLEPPPLGNDKHPLRQPLRQKKGNLKPQLFETWDWPGPKILEPVFAQRRARLQVCKSLPANANVLDIGSALPVLAFMLGKPAGHQLVEESGRVQGAVKSNWRLGEIDGVRPFSHFTALGVLEHVEDLDRLMGRLRRFDRPGIISYHTTDTVPLAHRSQHGWCSHLSREAMTAALHRAGFKFCANWRHDGVQSILFLEPA